MVHNNNNQKFQHNKAAKPLTVKLTKIAAAIKNAALMSSIAMAPGAAFAGPENGVIIYDQGGTSTITTPNVNTTTINQTGSSLYINWDSFNVSAAETVNFIQPDANSVALNNILDVNPTSILGQIDANGRIFLINPNGIVFGIDSSVNVNGLVASTLEMSSTNFENGNYVFSEGATQGDITNEGTLTAVSANGFITLLGHNVSNLAGGAILANKGQANLISAKQVTFDFAMDGLMQFTVDQAVADATTVANVGSITADDGWVVMSAKSADNIIANTVNNTGLLSASGVDTSTGEVYLVGGNGDTGLGQINAELLNVATIGNITSTDILTVNGTTTLNTANDSLISLTHTSNDFGVVTVASTGDNVTLADVNTLQLGAINSTHLTVITQGDITDVGTVVVTGVTTLNNGSGTAIILDDAGNDFSTITAGDAGDTVTLVDTDGIDLAAINATNLNVTANGDITNNGVLTVSGITTLNNGSGTTINLSNAGNDFGTVSIAGSGDTVTLVDINTIDLAATTATNLTVTSAGDITDSGALAVSGVTRLNSGGGALITLDNNGNDFGTVIVDSTSDTVALKDTNTIDLGSINATGLTVTASGNITQSGDLTIGSEASFTATAADVQLTRSNNFGSLALAGNNATVTENSSTILSGAALSGGLTLTSAGNITNTGALSVTGTTTLDNGVGTSITLGHGSNDFSTVTVVGSGDSVLLNDLNTIDLGAINAADLTVTAVNTISQSGDLSANTASFTAADVMLNTHNNNFATLALGGTNATVTEGSSMVLSGVTLGGNLTLTSVGDITDTGAVTVVGTSILDNGTGTVVRLDEVGNDFGTVRISGSGDTVELRDSNNIDLGASTAVNLTVTAVGNITDSGALTISGLTTLNSGGNALITLGDSGNNFGSVVVTSSNDTVVLSDIDTLDLGAVNATSLSVTANNAITQSGDLSIGSAASFNSADISLTRSNNFGTLTLAGTDASVNENSSTVLSGVNLGGQLNLTSAGDITDTGAVVVAGVTTLNNGAGSAITLDEVGNNFTTVTVTGSAGTVTLRDSDAIILGAMDATALTVTTAGNITDSGALTVAGITSLNSGNGATITLTNGGHDFNSVTVTSTGDSVTLNDSNALELGLINAADLSVTTVGDITQNGNLTTSGTATFNAADVLLNSQTNNFNQLSLTATNASVNENSSIDLSGATINGQLTLSSAGDITDSGVVTVTGTTTLNNGMGTAITLDEVGNNFATVTVTGAGGAVTLNDADSIDLGAITATALTVTTAGNITNSGALQVTGNAVFNSGNNASITLNNGGNDFAAVSVGSTGDSVVLIDSNTIDLGLINAADLTVTATGNITQSGNLTTSGNASFSAVEVVLDTQTNNFNHLLLTATNAAVNENSSINLASATINGNLTLSSAGDITDTGAVVVTGTTTLNNGVGTAITLDHNGNDFGTVVVTGSGDTVILKDISAIDLGTITATDLTVTTAGNITNTGALLVSGNSQFDSSNNALITLDDAGNDLNAVTVLSTGDTVTLNDINTIDLGAMNAANLTVIATNTITQSGILTIGTNARFSGADVTLNSQNNFANLALNATNAQVTQANDINLNGVTVNNLTLSTTGTISDSAAVVVSGTTTLTAGNSTAITLDHSGNNFATVTIASSDNAVSLRDTNAIDLGAMSVASLDVTAAGDITDSGSLIVSAGTLLNSGNGASITLDDTGNNFNSVAVGSTGDTIVLKDINEIDLGVINASALTVSAAGNISQSGGLTVSNNANFSGADVLLASYSNNFGSLSLTATNATVSQVNNSDLNGVAISGNLTLSSSGTLTDSAAVSVVGTTTLTATAITLDHAGNNFAQLNATSAAGAVELNDSDGINLGAINAASLNVTSAGDISNSGALVISGITTLNSGNGRVITLDHAGNNFGSVSVSSSGDTVILKDVDGIVLGTINTADLTVTAVGDISQNGNLTVSNNARFSGADVLLNTHANNFNNLALTATNATVNEADSLNLNGVNVSDLTLTSAGTINDSEAVVVSGTTTLDSGNGSTLVLDHAGNNFGTVSISSTGDTVTLRDSDGINLGIMNIANLNLTTNGAITNSGALTISGALILATGNNAAITLDNSDNDFNAVTVNSTGDAIVLTDKNALELGQMTAASLTVTAGGSITDSGAVVVSGTTNLSSGNNQAIILDDAGNDFTNVTVSSTGNTVALQDINTLDLGAINAASLTVSAVGNISQSGNLTTSGNASFSGAELMLNSQTNHFGSLSLTGNNATVITVSGTDLSGAALSGNLLLTTDGNITNSGAVIVSGTTTLDNGSGSLITLDDSANNFATVTVTGSGDTVVLADINEIDLGAINSTSLAVTAGTNITQSGDLTTINTARFNAADVTLNGSANHFGQLAVTATNATLSEADDTDLTGVTANTFTLTSTGNITDSGDTIVTAVSTFNAGGSITLDNAGNNFATVAITSNGNAVVLNDSDNIDLGSMNIASLDVSANGTISDSGAMVVTESTTLNASGAQAITLDDTGNDFSTVTVTSTGNSVSLNDINNLDLGAINATNLTVTTAGNLVQSGNLTVVGNANFSAADITLNTQTNQFGTLGLAGNSATVTETDGTDFNGVSLTNNLTLTAGGDITDSGAIVVSGTTRLNNGSGSQIILDHGANDFNTVHIDSSGDAVTLNDINTIDLAAMNATSLSVTAGGAITDSGALIITGQTSLSSGNNQAINLDHGSNDFASVSVTSSGNSVSLNDVNGLDLGLVNATDLTVTAVGNISQSGNLTTTGNARFNGADVSLASQTNNFGSLTVNATNVTITEASDTDLNGVTATNLTLTSSGAIADSAAVVVSDLTRLTAGNNSLITLDHSGNNFGTVSINSTGNAVTLRDSDSIILGSMNTESLNLTTNGSISASGVLAISGALTLATGNNSTISLDDSDNDFGSVTVTSTGDIISVNDKNAIELGPMASASLSVAAGGNISQSSGLAITGDASFVANGADVQLSHSANNFGKLFLSADNAIITEASSTELTSVTVGGNFSLTSGGDINDTGAVVVNGIATFDSAGNNITLDYFSNDFATVAVTSGADGVILNDINGLDLGAMNAATLNVTAAGSITNSGAVVVSGLTTLSSLNNGAISLDHSGNDFATVAVSSTGNSVTLNDSNAIVIDTLSATDLSVTAATNISQSGNLTIANNASFNGADVSLDNHINNFGSLSLTANNATVIAAGDSDLTNVAVTNLTLTSAGNISDSGAVSVSGIANLSTGGNATIALDHSGNNFGTVTIGSSGDAVTLRDSSTLNLGAMNTASLNITTGGHLTDSGAIVVSGLTTLNAAGNQAITLDGSSNDFATVAVTSGTGAVTLKDTNSIVLGEMGADSLSVMATDSISQSGNLTITNNANFSATTIALGSQTNRFGSLDLTATDATVTEADSTDLSGVSVTNLTLTSADGISDSGALNVTGLTTLSSGNNAAITLDQGSNNFATVTIASDANTVVLNDVDSIDLGGMNSAALSVTSAGNITDSGALVIAGLTTLNSGNGQTVTLDEAGNNFATLAITSSNDSVTVIDSNGIDLGVINAADLTLTTAGDITDSGTVTVAGLTQLDSGDNAAITLDNASNDFNTITVLSTGDALTFSDSNALELSAMNAASLAVTTAGNVTDSGTLVVSGLTTLDSGNNAQITLDNTNNDFGTVAVTSTGDTVELTDINAIVLGGMTSASINLTAGGNISQSGALNISDNARFTTAMADVLLNSQRNNFGHLTLSANNVAITEASATELNGVTVTNDLTLTSAGAITDTSAVIVAGETVLDSGDNASIILDDSNNNFATLTVNSSGDSVVLTDVDTINLGGGNMADLAVTASGDITQSGGIAVSNNASFITPTADVILNTNSNNFGSLSLNANNALVDESSAMDMLNATVGGNLTVTAVGDITDSGSVQVVGLTTLNSSGSGAIILDDAGNNFSTVAVTSDGNNIVLNDLNAIDLGTVNAASLAVTAGGDITDSGVLTVAGITRVNTGDNGLITLDGTTNDFTTVTVASTGDTVVLNDINGIELGGMNAQALSVDAGGNITQSAAVQVAGDARFSAINSTNNADILLGNSLNDFGSLTLSANNAAVTAGNSIDLASVALSADLTLTAAGDITDSGAVTVAGLTTLNSGNGRLITLDETANDFAAVTVQSTGDTVVLNDSNDIVLGTMNVANLAVTAASGISQNGGLNVTDLASFSSQNAAVLLASQTNNFGRLTLNAASAQVSESSSTDLNSVTVVNDFTLTSAGNIDDSGAITIGGLTTFNSGGNATITLDDSGNNFTTVTVLSSGDAITLTDRDTLDFGTINAASLNVSTNGAISSSGAVVVTGLTTLDSGNGQRIALDQAGTDFGSVTVTSTGDSISLTDSNAITLDTIAANDLAVVAGGEINQSGDLQISNIADFSATNAAVTLNTQNNDFGTLALTANSAAITAVAGIDLGNVTLGSDFTLSAGGNITDSGAVVVAGNTRFNSGNNALITLDNGNNDFAAVVIESTGDTVVLNDIGGIDLGAMNLTNLTLTTTGDITNSGAVIVSETATLNNANNRSVILDNSANDFNRFELSNRADTVVLNDSNDIEVAAIDATTLNITAQGVISQSGAFIVTSNGSFSADDVQLNTATNQFGSLTLNAANASVTEADSSLLAGVNITENLTLSAVGEITDSGIIKVGGTATFNSGNGGVITLDESGNDFATVAISSRNDTVLLSDTNDIQLGTIEASSLTVSAAGDITGSATVIVSGDTTLSGNGQITLDDSDNDFNQVVVLSEGNAVTLTDVNAIELAAINADSLNINAGQDISQSGDFIVSGNARFTTDANVVLDSQSGNQFGSLSLNAVNAQIKEADGSDLTDVAVTHLTLTAAGDITNSGAVVVAGTATLNSGNDNNITLDHGANDFGIVTIKSTGDTVTLNDINNIDLAAMNVASLAVTANNNIIDSGALVVKGATTLTTGGNAVITLSNSGNDFNTVTVASEGDAITLNDINNIELGKITSASLAVTATDTISQSGNLTITDNARFTTDTAVVLDTNENNFGSLTLAADTAKVSEGSDIQLNGVNINNDLTLTANGNITDIVNTAVTVLGMTRLDSGNNAVITLDNVNNDFTSVSVTSSADAVTLTDSNTLDLAAITAASLGVKTSGDITNSGALKISGTTTLDSGNDQSIVLTDSQNDFAQITVTSSGDTVTLQDINAIDLGQMNAKQLGVEAGQDISQFGDLTIAGNARFTTVGNVTLARSNQFNSITLAANSAVITEADSTDLNGVTVQSDLTLSAGGSITDSDTVIVKGITTLSSANNAAITLDGINNNFGTVTVTSLGNAVTLNDSDSLVLGAMTSESLTVNAINNITQSGELVIATNARFTTDAAVTLLNQANQFGTITLTADTASITEADATHLNGVDLETNFTLISADAITSSDTVIVKGLTTLSSGNNAAITLANENNDFAKVAVDSTGNIVTLNDSNSIELQAMSAAGLNVTAKGDITQAGALAISSNASFTTDTNVTLNDANAFGTLSITANQATVNEIDATNLSGVSLGSDFSLTSAGDISSSGAVVVVGVTSLSSGSAGDSSGAITLNEAGNNFTSVTIASTGNAVTLNDINGIDLGQMNVTSLNVTAAGSITDSGTLTVADITILDSGDNQQITLDGQNNNFGSVAVTSTNDTVVLNDSNAIVLDTINAADLTVTAAGHISQLGNLTIANTATFTTTDEAGVADVVLTGNGNNFGDLTVTTNDMQITEQSDTLLNEIVVSGDLSLTSTANISQAEAGNISVTGNARFDAVNVDLTNNTNNFGSLTLAATNATIDEDSSTELDGINVSTGLDLTAAGTISQVQDSVINVQGDASFTVLEVNGELGNVTLDNGSNSFGSVALTGQTVSLTETGAMVLNGVSAQGDVTLSSGGAITQRDGSSITVIGNARFTATNVTLGGDSNSFGSLALTANAATINEVDGTVLNGVEIANNLVLSAGGDITQLEGSAINVNLNTRFDTVGNIDIGSDTATANFGTLTLKAKNVIIEEDSASELNGVEVTENLSLTALGDITQSAGADINVAGNAGFSTTTNIILDSAGNETTNSFGSLSLVAENATIVEDDATELNSVTINQALVLTSAGEISQTVDPNGGQAVAGRAIELLAQGQTTVGGNATFTTAGDIVLNNATNDFSSLTLAANNVTIGQSSAAELNGVTVSNLTLNAQGAITQSDVIVVTGTTTLSSGDGQAITLTDENNDFGTLSVASSGDSVNVVDINNLDLGTMSTGSITVNAQSISQSGAISTTAGGNIDLQAQTTITLTSVDSGGNLIAFTQSGDIITASGGQVSSTGSLLLDSGANITANGDISSNGAMMATTAVGDIALTNVEAQTVSVSAVNGVVVADQIHATATEVAETANVQITAREVGAEDGIELLIDAGTATVAVANVNNTTLVDNEASRTLLVQVFNASATTTERGGTVEITESTDISDVSSAADAGNSAVTIEVEADDLGSEVSLYSGSDVKLPLGQEPELEEEFEDEFEEGEENTLEDEH